MSVLPDDVKSWKCEICARILLSKAGYVNHKKSHEKDLGYANLLPFRGVRLAHWGGIVHRTW